MTAKQVRSIAMESCEVQNVEHANLDALKEDLQLSDEDITKTERE